MNLQADQIAIGVGDNVAFSAFDLLDGVPQVQLSADPRTGSTSGSTDRSGLRLSFETQRNNNQLKSNNLFFSQPVRPRRPLESGAR